MNTSCCKDLNAGILCKFCFRVSPFLAILMTSLSGESQSMALRSCEEKIIAAMKKKNVKSLCQDLYVRTLISKEIMDKFTSLDHDSLPLELMVRYLLQHVYDAVKDNKLVYSFLNILSEVDGSVADELRIEVHKYKLAELVGESQASQSDVSVDVKRSRASISGYKLCEQNVSLLTEFLAECSHRWEELGIVLGLLRHQIEECRKGTSNQIRLYKIIAQWISNMENPTISKLKNALSSNLVGMHSKACQIEEHFLTEIKAVTLKKHCLECELQPIFRSGDTEVANGKSALLGFQVASANPLGYHWRKNGQPLSDNEVYSGTHSAILFISCVGGQTKGQYECEVYNESYLVKTSEKMYLKVSCRDIQVYSKYFSNFYKEVHKDSCPPVSTNKFINLALIRKHKQTKDDFAYAVQGDMDDIIGAKEKVEFEEVFGQYNSGALILVEGQPGSGKTTLMHKVARDWALKRNILVNAVIVVLVPMRLFRTNVKDITLSDILEMCIRNDEERCKVLYNIEKVSGEGVCFIFDGLDEYEHHNDCDTTVLKLISKYLLPLAMVIVASRPVGTALVRNGAPVTERIEVLGFKNDQIQEYIKCYYNEDQNMTSKLISYLKANINVYHMCYLPVHAAMICFLYSNLGENIPQTETKIYESFTCFTLLRKVNCEKSQHKKIDLLLSLTGDIEEYFNNICKLAFDMTIHSKQVVLQSQTQFPLPISGSDKSSLGLVTVDSTAELFGIEDLYTFLHLTFQEYLAAFYLAGLEDEKQVISKTKEKQANLQMVWKFYCGMVQFKAHSLILSYILSNTDLDMLYKIQCAFESQQQIVCDSVLELDKADTLSFKDHSLIPTDFLGISYVITTTSYIVTTLTFTDCSLDGEGVALFLEKVSSDHLDHIKYLGYHKHNCLVSQFKTLNMLLRKLTSLETLDLLGTELGVQGVQRLTEDVKLPNLSTLKLQVPLKKNVSDEAKVFKLLNFNSLKLEEIHYLCPKSKSYFKSGEHVNILAKAFGNLQFFSSNQIIYYVNHTFEPESQRIKVCFQRCSKLVLINCGINDDVLNILVESMTICPELDTLRLDFNRITSKGATLLSNFLEACTKLEVFSAHCNKIDDSGALAIANALVQLNNIKILDLQCNPISQEGASVLMLTVKDLGEDFKLYMSTNIKLSLVQQSVNVICANNPEINAIHRALKCSSLMQEVHISLSHESYVQIKNPITFACSISKLNTAAAALLAEGMKCCTNLQTLDLSSNSIGSEGAVSLAEGLKCCTNLQTLDLSYNSIGSEDAVSLAEGLKCCTNLQTLDLSSNSIGSEGAVPLAEGLKCCTNLQTLDLSSNSIGSGGAVSLAEGLKCCTNLQTLDLSSNSIGSEGAVSLAGGLKCCTNLQTLDLSLNNIGLDGAVALAVGLKCCTNLRTLDLSSDSIGSGGAAGLAEGLKCCTNLQTLDLSSNSIGSEGAVSLAGGLKCCTNLQTLDLSLNNIGLDGAVALAVGLKCCTNLRTLDLSSDSIGSGGAAGLAEVLKCCTNLQTLNLSSNSIGSEGAVSLAEGLKCCTNLQTLDLSSTSIGSEGAMSLAEGLKCCTNLQTLDLGCNSIGSEGAVFLAEGLKCCTNLQTLDLSYNSIGSGGAVGLAEGLKCCTNLQTLDLSSNSIGSEGAVSLAEGLKCSTNLQTLDLSYNSIGSGGAVGLAEGLKCCTNLQTLDLSTNSIGSEGAVSLAEGLKCCTNLQTLDLRYNSIGSEGALALAVGLKCCTNLQTLDLRYNSIGSEGAVALAEGLKCCTNLQTLDLRYNSIGSDGAVALAEGLKFCTNIQTLSECDC